MRTSVHSRDYTRNIIWWCDGRAYADRHMKMLAKSHSHHDYSGIRARALVVTLAFLDDGERSVYQQRNPS